jgi:hypothetical protein
VRVLALLALGPVQELQAELQPDRDPLVGHTALEPGPVLA